MAFLAGREPLRAGERSRGQRGLGGVWMNSEFYAMSPVWAKARIENRGKLLQSLLACRIITRIRIHSFAIFLAGGEAFANEIRLFANQTNVEHERSVDTTQRVTIIRRGG